MRASLTQATAAVRPPPSLTISQWADECLYLSAEDSAEPGRFSTDRAPYQSGILDALSEPGIHTVVVMSSAQIGKTVLLKAIIGYHVDQDPAPILMLQPTEAMAEAFSKDRLAPMIRDTPALRDKIADPRARDSGNTILHKRFAGGHLTLVGANSAAGLASRPIRVVLCDEVDRYPASAGAEGDPVNLAIKRAATFWNRRVVLTSTPSIKGVSRIERAFNLSDQRRYYVPCPHCQEFHHWRWASLHFDPANLAVNPVMACPGCGGVIEERHKPRLLGAGEWRPDNPAAPAGVAGFHLNELYSPWRRWAEVVADFLAAKGNPETLKVWVNTSLGEPWEESAQKSDPDRLLTRRENYDAALLPGRVLYLTAGVDSQDDRLECSVWGWRQEHSGSPPESWLIEHRVLTGNPAHQAVWDDLDALLLTTYRTETGRTLRIGAAGIDSGGHHVAQVYAFCAERAGRQIYAIKGMGNRPIWTGRASKSRKYRAKVWPVGDATAKEAIYDRLQVDTPGPGYVHFPISADPSYFAQLVSEQIRTRYRNGVAYREWFLPSGRHNEALDCAKIALAVLHARPVPWAELAATPASALAQSKDQSGWEAYLDLAPAHAAVPWEAGR